MGSNPTRPTRVTRQYANSKSGEAQTFVFAGWNPACRTRVYGDVGERLNQQVANLPRLKRAIRVRIAASPPSWKVLLHGRQLVLKTRG